MKAVIEKTTDRVIFLFEDSDPVELTEDMMFSSEQNAIDVNSLTHEIVQADAPQSPLVFVAGALAYNGVWSIYDQDTYDLMKDRVIARKSSMLAEIRAAVWEQIKAIRDTKTLKGGYPASGKWFHSDTFSRTQQIGLFISGANVPAIQWKTMDGTFISMTQALAAEIFSAAAAQDTAMFTYAENLKTQVDASDNPTSIDITAGWPATYGGI